MRTWQFGLTPEVRVVSRSSLDFYWWLTDPTERCEQGKTAHRPLRSDRACADDPYHGGGFSRSPSAVIAYERVTGSLRYPTGDQPATHFVMSSK